MPNQARGGCACAGPYGLSLLGISPEDSAAIESHLLDKMEVLRPGFVRVSLPYFAEPAELALVTGALAAIATHGWRLLPDYAFNYKSGEWRHASRLRSFPERRWLGDFAWPTHDQSQGDNAGGGAGGEAGDDADANNVPSNGYLPLFFVFHVQVIFEFCCVDLGTNSQKRVCNRRRTALLR